MKLKTTIITLMLLLSLGFVSNAAEWISLKDGAVSDTGSKPEVTFVKTTANNFKTKVVIGSVLKTSELLNKNSYDVLSVPGYNPCGKFGFPALPAKKI